jgi:hypothetical protein
MSSGSLNIDSFSWYRSLPLSNDTTGYSTGTLFAVGPSSFEVPYTFYQYQSTVGFTDTSTMSVAVANYVAASLQSTVNGIGFNFQSTIPLVKWVSTNDTSYQSSVPVTGWPAQPIDFVSTYTTDSQGWPIEFQTDTMWMGTDLPALIESKKYTVAVDFQYSLFTSTNTAVNYNYYSWVSTIGFLGSNTGTVGKQITTRVGNQTYTTLQQKLVFNPQTTAEQITNGQIGITPSSFWFKTVIGSNIANTIAQAPSFDVFVPGENNVTFTLTPFRSILS